MVCTVYAGLKGFLRSDTTALRRVLRAFVLHRPSFGYVPNSGLTHIASLLLAFNSEEEVFWLLVAAATELRASPDFYSPLPAPMNGFHIETRVLTESLVSRKLVASSGAASPVVERVASNWLCSLFWDSVSLPVQIAILNHYFSAVASGGGDGALFRVAAAVVESAGDAKSASAEAWTKSAAELSLPAALKALRSGSADASESQWREAARKQLAAKWNESSSHLAELSKATRFSQAQLEQFQSAFKQLYSKETQGMTYHRL